MAKKKNKSKKAPAQEGAVPLTSARSVQPSCSNESLIANNGVKLTSNCTQPTKPPSVIVGVIDSIFSGLTIDEERHTREDGSGGVPHQKTATGNKSGRKKGKVPVSKVEGLFYNYFGESKLANWQRLCVDLGLGDRPLLSINQCKKAAETVHVNIYDFLDAVNMRKLSPTEAHRPLNVRIFGSVQALADYSWKTKRIYPVHRAKKDGALRLLLRRISFHE